MRRAGQSRVQAHIAKGVTAALAEQMVWAVPTDDVAADDTAPVKRRVKGKS